MYLCAAKRWIIFVCIAILTPLCICANKPHAVAVELRLYCYRTSMEKRTEILIFKQPNGLWTCCSGFLQPNETFKDAGKRILISFADINVSRLTISAPYSHNEGGKVMPGLALLCKAYAEDIVILKHKQFVDYMWAELSDLDSLHFVNDDLKKDLIKILVTRRTSW